MNYSRSTSLDNVLLTDWAWSSFLNYTIETLSTFTLEPYLIEKKYLTNVSYLGKGSNSFRAQNETWACTTEKFKLVRAACVKAPNIASVFNLLITPFPFLDLPFFGADFVSLPNGHLIALDLQPALKSDISHTQEVWERLLPIHHKWQSLLPSGGEIPREAQQYFSPGFLWTRIPLGIQGDKLISEVISPAYRDYFSLYLDLVLQAKKINNVRASEILHGQKSYMSYRARKDPARGLLARFFGKEWTDSYINNILFDLT